MLGYYFLSLVLYAVLPASTPLGTTLRTGGRLQYRFNGLSSALVTLGGLAAGTFVYGTKHFPVWTYVWDNYVPIITANILVSTAISFFVYANSFSVAPNDTATHRLLAEGGHSGNMVYDWFIGRELNPRVHLPGFGDIDLKIFCEMRPGLLGWLVLDYTFLAHQYSTYGFVSDSMLLVCAFHTVYVVDALYMEPSILTTMDITTDGFGFMLAFGDLVWVPSIYSLQARYLAVYPVQLGMLGTAGVLGVQALGYYVFRGANNQKNTFRTDPNHEKVKGLKFIQTKQGSKLLIEGWWGLARHVNYLGDWIMAWAWCLPTGISGYLVTVNGAAAGEGIVQGDAKGWGMLVTYFYVLYFAVLLAHRERRDDDKCFRKYGESWEEYRRTVRSRILPGIY